MCVLYFEVVLGLECVIEEAGLFADDEHVALECHVLAADEEVCACVRSELIVCGASTFQLCCRNRLHVDVDIGLAHSGNRSSVLIVSRRLGQTLAEPRQLFLGRYQTASQLARVIGEEKDHKHRLGLGERVAS